MNFKELAARITGVSFPVFGIQWTPPKLDVDTARKVINFLENKRVLYNAYELESPDYCMQSLIQIRDYLTEQLNDVSRGSELDGILRGMRATCRVAMDEGAHNYKFDGNSYGNFGPLDAIRFFSAVGVLRGNMGILIARLAIMFGLEVEEQILKIIPIELA